MLWDVWQLSLSSDMYILNNVLGLFLTTWVPNMMTIIVLVWLYQLNSSLEVSDILFIHYNKLDIRASTKNYIPFPLSFLDYISNNYPMSLCYGQSNSFIQNFIRNWNTEMDVVSGYIRKGEMMKSFSFQLKLFYII